MNFFILSATRIQHSADTTEKVTQDGSLQNEKWHKVHKVFSFDLMIKINLGADHQQRQPNKKRKPYITVIPKKSSSGII